MTQTEIELNNIRDQLVKQNILLERIASAIEHGVKR